MLACVHVFFLFVCSSLILNLRIVNKKYVQYFGASHFKLITCIGRGGAGRGGGCFAFFGGSAGLGDSGRGGGAVFDPRPEPIHIRDGEREREKK